MLNPPPNTSFLLAREPVNMSLSFDGLLAAVRGTLHADPLSPTFFIFLNKNRDKVKIMYWDDDGDLPSRPMERYYKAVTCDG